MTNEDKLQDFYLLCFVLIITTFFIVINHSFNLFYILLVLALIVSFVCQASGLLNKKALFIIPALFNTFALLLVPSFIIQNLQMRVDLKYGLGYYAGFVLLFAMVIYLVHKRIKKAKRILYSLSFVNVFVFSFLFCNSYSPLNDIQTAFLLLCLVSVAFEFYFCAQDKDDKIKVKAMLLVITVIGSLLISIRAFANLDTVIRDDKAIKIIDSKVEKLKLTPELLSSLNSETSEDYISIIGYYYYSFGQNINNGQITAFSKLRSHSASTSVLLFRPSIYTRQYFNLLTVEVMMTLIMIAIATVLGIKKTFFPAMLILLIGLIVYFRFPDLPHYRFMSYQYSFLVITALTVFWFLTNFIKNTINRKNYYRKA